MNPTRVRIFYPADPLGVVPGGIDTFIRGILKWAPEDLRFSLVGMTTDASARPVGRFTRCTLGGRSFEFHPAVAVEAAGQRGRVPLSLRYTAAVARRRAALSRDFDVFDFHRSEPALLFGRDARPKNAFFHQDPQDIVDAPGADVLWRHAPQAYRAVESRVATGLASAWCVRASGVQTLQGRYPALADRIRFVPTWVDDTVFFPASLAQRAVLRERLGARLRLDPAAVRIVTVGRLDTQKNPELMLAAVARLVAEGRRVVWLVVGDGPLRPRLEQQAAALGIGEQVRFLGLCSAEAIARLHQAADVYALSSGYEGMPIALLEALGCGLPVATTDVGEVRRVVGPGVNGSIAAAPTPEAFAACLAEVIDHAASYGGAAAVDATEPYRPAVVLEPVFENYRALGELAEFRRQSRLPGTSLPIRFPYEHRVQERVIRAPIDVLRKAQARRVVLDWARARESRYVCFCNVHSAVAYTQDAQHRRAIDHADMVAPDGAPIAWMLRRKGHAAQRRIDGPNMMWSLCRDAQQAEVKVGLYGSTPETVRALRGQLRRSFPALHVSFCESPPFGPSSDTEDARVCADIEAAGVGLLFVALGCPKQEHWMATHVGRIPAVMLGVGAAFDFHAGLMPRAPRWAQSNGFEWLHRLVSDPRRLWRRYLTSNSVFIMRGAHELTRKRSTHPTARARIRPAGRRSRVVSAMPSSHREEPPVNHHIEELLTRVDAAVRRHNGRVIEFVASGEGEGTSTLATAYAHLAADQLKRRVLLLDAQSGSAQRPGVLDTLDADRPIAEAVRLHPGGYARGSLFGVDEANWSLAARSDPWKKLRSAYDEIVLDMPSAAASHAGVMIAPRCDGVIVVIEAEKTRAPVLEAMVANLQAVHANLLGMVLNKRQFHVPGPVYRRL